MIRGARPVALLCGAVLVAGCAYIVVPAEEGGRAGGESKGWTAVATSVGPADSGDLRIDLTIQNETADWSAMVATGPASLTAADGSSASCASVFVGTGGHRLAPGMQMRGYVAGPKAAQTIELIRVECVGAPPAAGGKLSLNYRYVTGDYNYYHPDDGHATGTLEVNLDQLATDLAYPIAQTVEGIVVAPDVEITAINDVLLTLVGVERTDTGLAFDWHTQNPGEYPSNVHIGVPPVIGADGILYGFYESPDLESVPVTAAGAGADWTTEVTVPSDGSGFYILLSVESKKQRLFVHYAIDVSAS